MITAATVAAIDPVFLAAISGFAAILNQVSTYTYYILMTQPDVEADAAYVERVARDVIHDPRAMGRRRFLGLWFDAGLTWVHFPQGSGGLPVLRHRFHHDGLRHAGGTGGAPDV